MMKVETTSKAKACPVNVWPRRILAGSFLFFLIKGLVWLGLGAAALWWAI